MCSSLVIPSVLWTICNAEALIKDGSTYKMWCSFNLGVIWNYGLAQTYLSEFTFTTEATPVLCWCQVLKIPIWTETVWQQLTKCTFWIANHVSLFGDFPFYLFSSRRGLADGQVFLTVSVCTHVCICTYACVSYAYTHTNTEILYAKLKHRSTYNCNYNKMALKKNNNFSVSSTLTHLSLSVLMKEQNC